MLQVMTEGISQIARCVVVVIGVTMATEWGLLVFCMGQVRLRAHGGINIPLFYPLQLAYSLCYLFIYYGYFTLHISTSHPHYLPIYTIAHILPSPGPNGVICLIVYNSGQYLYCALSPQKWFRSGAVTLSWSFFKQSFLKQLLTDGELLSIPLCLSLSPSFSL